MRTIIQRVSQASVLIDQKVISEINKGLLILLGVEDSDSEEDVHWLVGKMSQMRIFSDTEGKMNLSIQEVNGDAIIVSQFTLFSSTKKGNRPSFMKAAKAEHAKKMYEMCIKELQKAISGKVLGGVFGGDMKVGLVNDGPVTIFIDSKNKE